MPKKKAAPGDHPRKQTAQTLIRMDEIERQFMEEAAAKKTAEIRQTVSGARVGITQFIRSGGIRLAEEVLGITFDAYAKKAAGKGNGK